MSRCSPEIITRLARWLLAPAPDGLGMDPQTLTEMLLEEDPHAALRAFLAPFLEAHKYTSKAPAELWTLAQWEYHTYFTQG